MAQTPQDDALHEECAVFGVSLARHEEAAGVAYAGLLSLQHRGQEGAGIAVVSENNIICRKGEGLASELFPDGVLAGLPKGRTAVGHTLYSKAGGSEKKTAGPFVQEYLTGRIVAALSGSITNADEIRRELTDCGLQFDTSSDGEVVTSLIAYHISQERDLLSGAAKAAGMLEGAFSIVIASGSDKVAAVRDPNGFRPLCLGRSEAGAAVASESCALDSCGFEFVRDVRPGEVVIIENGKITEQGVKLEKRMEAGHGLCIFEFVYFARADSIIDGLSVYNARQRMGRVLAEEYPADADVVCGAPDTGLDAANGYSAESGIPLVSGFVRNQYIGRSFIYPTQIQRESAVRLKLNPLSASIGGKRVVFVDDSIVRGTTTETTVKSLKAAGAKEVHVRISSPPVRYTCYYGTNIDREENLIANKTGLDGIRRKIGADSLGFISIAGLKRACGECRLNFCTACYIKEHR